MSAGLIMTTHPIRFSVGFSVRFTAFFRRAVVRGAAAMHNAPFAHRAPMRHADRHMRMRSRTAQAGRTSLSAGNGDRPATPDRRPDRRSTDRAARQTR
ncbi:hypothetical protein [Paraburkholderia caballeronis]|uniref:hypothetical protein n=1 Tax=Paraburkholderia caballeronis TaxID=416943 RepID=UPI00106622AF|nr:hypothetical protein [Paraburkholderia caballeronis]